MEARRNLTEAWIVTKYKRSGIFRPQRIKVGPNCKEIAWVHHVHELPDGLYCTGYLAFPGRQAAFEEQGEAKVVANRANAWAVVGHRTMRDWHDKAASRIELHRNNPTGGRK